MFRFFKKKTFDITFTIHAIKRISTRFQSERSPLMIYPVGNQLARYRPKWNYIDPKLMKAIIEDAKNIIDFKYCRRDDTILSVWSIWIYVFDRWGKVVTVMNELTEDYIQKHFLVFVSDDFLKKFMESDRDSKPFNPEYW